MTLFSDEMRDAVVARADGRKSPAPRVDVRASSKPYSRCPFSRDAERGWNRYREHFTHQRLERDFLYALQPLLSHQPVAL